MEKFDIKKLEVLIETIKEINKKLAEGVELSVYKNIYETPIVYVYSASIYSTLPEYFAMNDNNIAIMNVPILKTIIYKKTPIHILKIVIIIKEIDNKDFTKSNNTMIVIGIITSEDDTVLSNLSIYKGCKILNEYDYIVHPRLTTNEYNISLKKENDNYYLLKYKEYGPNYTHKFQDIDYEGEYKIDRKLGEDIFLIILKLFERILLKSKEIVEIEAPSEACINIGYLSKMNKEYIRKQNVVTAEEEKQYARNYIKIIKSQIEKYTKKRDTIFKELGKLYIIFLNKIVKNFKKKFLENFSNI